MPNNIIMADAKGGSSTEITGIWGKAYVEKITAGENSVTNTTGAFSYIASLTQESGTVVAMWRKNEESPAPQNNEFGGGTLNVGHSKGARYRDGVWNYSTPIVQNYDGAVTSGSVFYVVHCDLALPF